MKKSLHAFSLGLSLFILSCHKESIQSVQTLSNATKTSNQRGGDVGGSSDGVTPFCTTCLMTYPDASNTPRSLEVFNENEVLVAAEPGIRTCGDQPDEIKIWYTDEHPICLGVRQVIIKTKGKTDIKDFTILPSPTKSASNQDIDPSLLGATDLSGDYTGNDVAVDGGRPLWPAMYITDLGTDVGGDLTSRAGDWQQGTAQNPTKAYPPNKIYGMWKTAVRTVDKTKTPNLVTITMDSDPQKSNGWDLAGGQAPPFGTYNQKYGAMVSWDVNKLISQKVFKAGHIYRLQFMVHDGDQNKTGGDVGQSCTTIFIH